MNLIYQYLALNTKYKEQAQSKQYLLLRNLSDKVLYFAFFSVAPGEDFVMTEQQIEEEMISSIIYDKRVAIIERL